MEPGAGARPLSPVGRLGAWTLRCAGEACYVVAVATRVLLVALNPRSWPRTTRNVLARQIYFTGVGALPFTLLLALLVGVSVVLQAQLWLERAGQEALLGPVLVTIVLRELAPLLANTVVLVRSGSAIVTELATMTVAGEVRLLESEGLDPLGYLVLPRVVGVTISLCCLSLFFVVASMISGYLASLALGHQGNLDGGFMWSVLSAVESGDLVHALAKTLLPAFLTTIICCVDGLGAGSARTDIPKAATRALSRAIAALFISSALLSIVAYL
ncbi:MAG: phospholipid/cholesterol/gamma-HCH transport system permease protein [Chlamydiales bacterium]|jgi:phospholipid/cholesterol/gamma-HCH transport system permease protein